jgi:glycosyltransferase involved in cell wall biosynthesis
LASYHREARVQGTYKRAEGVFRNALEAYPKHRLIHFKVIDLLLRQGKFAEAMSEIEKAIVEYGVDDGFIAAALSVRKKRGPKEIDDPSEKEGTVSLCMIVRDEEPNIGRCLLNLKPLADEMIVVDTGSTDRTKALAEIFGAKVNDFEWNDDFSAARNHSLSKAVGDWILVMDADEIISPRDYDALKKIIKTKRSKAQAFSFVTRNYHIRTNIIGMKPNDGAYKDEETGYGWVPTEKVRLFRNGLNIKFEFPVHEVVGPFLRRNRINIAVCSVPVHHYGRLNSNIVQKKDENYYILGIKKLEEVPDDAKAIYELAIQAGGLQKWEESVALWQRYNAMCPDNPTAYINIGMVYQNMGRLDLAIESVKRAIELDPDADEPYNNYALYQILLGNAGTAVPVLERLEKRSPTYLPGRFKLATAYACTGRKTDALRVFDALEKTTIGPSLFKACHSIAKLVASSGQSGYASIMTGMAARTLTGAFNLYEANNSNL